MLNKNMQDDDKQLQHTLNEVEHDLLLRIIWYLRNRKITVLEAEKLARDFLAVLPVQDQHDLLAKIKSLGSKYPQARDVYVKYAEQEYEEKRGKALSIVAEHIQNGEIEKALEAAKGGNN